MADTDQDREKPDAPTSSRRDDVQKTNELMKDKARGEKVTDPIRDKALEPGGIRGSSD